jgi:hypothetical protein
LVGLSPTEHTSFFLDTLPDGRVSQVRFEALAFRRLAFPSCREVQALVRIHPVDGRFADRFVPGPGYGLMCPVLSSRARACRRNHQVPRVSLPDLGVTSVRETWTVSSEDITPRSSLLQTHSPILIWFSSSSAVHLV